MQSCRLIRAPRTLLAPLLLALSLLVSQGFVQAHIYSHLHAGSSGFDFGTAANPLCSDCLAGAALLSAAGSPTAPQIFSTGALVLPAPLAGTSRLETSHQYAFRSRAPPAFL